MKTIKLLVVTPYFYPDAGGVANHTYNLYKKMANKPKIAVITSGKENKITKEKIANMRVYKLPASFKISNTPMSLKWKKQIKEIIEKENPDAIMGHMPVTFICDIALSIALKKKIPFIIKYHHGGSMKKGEFPIDVLIWIYETIFLKRILKKSSKIAVSSEFVKKDFMKEYSEKVITITPAVDMDVFKPKNTSSKNNLLFVANLKKSEYYKGLNFLLEAIKIVKKQIPEIRLTIVGDGDYTNFYKSMVNDMSLEKNVSFSGRLSGIELTKKYQNTNILVLPSLFEATPNVLLEAMACKKPVIGTKVGGIPYVIDNGKDGLLVPQKDSQALADAIIKILSNPKLAKQMGENGYKKVKENFTWNKKADETMALFKKVLN